MCSEWGVIDVPHGHLRPKASLLCCSARRAFDRILSFDCLLRQSQSTVCCRIPSPKPGPRVPVRNEGYSASGEPAAGEKSRRHVVAIVFGFDVVRVLSVAVAIAQEATAVGSNVCYCCCRCCSGMPRRCCCCCSFSGTHRCSCCGLCAHNCCMIE